MSKEFFPPRPESRPTIYAYEDTNPQYEGLLPMKKKMYAESKSFGGETT